MIYSYSSSISNHHHHPITSCYNYKINPNETFLNVCKTQHYNLNYIKCTLKQENIDPSFNNNQIVINACYLGHKDIVKLLLKDHYYVKKHKGKLSRVVQKGNLEIVKQMYPKLYNKYILKSKK